MAGVGVGSVQRELKARARAGIIRARANGHLVYYQADSLCPVYAELKGLIVKTAGIGDTLKAALATLSDRIQAAFIYGSLASDQEHRGTDVDVCIVGPATFTEVVAALSPAQQDLGREINPTVFPPEEFRTKRASHHHFLVSLMNRPKIFLVGDEHALEKLAR